MANAATVGATSQALASACSDVIDRARASITPQVLSAEEHERDFLASVAHLDIPGAKKAWAALGSRRGETLASGLHCQQGIFATWATAAKNGAAWGVSDDVVVDMLLWLDEIGACPVGDPPHSKTTRARVEGLASGGAARRAVRAECIPAWAFACEKPYEIAPCISRALACLGARWLSDPDEEARVPPSAWIKTAFFSSEGLPRPSSFLNLLADMWPSFGFPPTPEHWRMIADGWILSEDGASGYRSVAAVGQLLNIGSERLPPEAANRLAFMAARLGYVSILRKVALRCDEFPLASHASFIPFDHSVAPLAEVASKPAPLILVAAMAPILLRWEPRRSSPPVLGHCFEALSMVPEAVQAALAGGPRPDLLALADPRVFAELHRRFPAWFEPNAQGENVMHLLARSPKVTADDTRFFIASCVGVDALAEMLGARSNDGATPLSLFLASARDGQARDLVDELLALSEAAELRSATRPQGAAQALRSSAARL